MRKKNCGPERCPDCPFKSRTVGNRGPEDAKIVIVGESPGSQELIHGEPFIGPSGELLSHLLEEVGINESEVFITNAIQCLPPRSKDAKGKSVKDAVLNDASRACRERLIKTLSAYPRELIITMGSAAARTMSERWGYSIMKERGQVLETPAKYSKFGVLPTYHPAYILRNPAATPQLKADLRKAKAILDRVKFVNPKIQYHVLDSETQIDKALLECAEHSRYIVSDIETTGLDRFKDKFLCIGFISEGLLKPFGMNTVYVVTGKGQGKLVRHLAKRVRELELKWVWHNGKFDTSFLRAKGISREHLRVDHDTLLMSYTLDETGGRHSLEQCIVDHLGLPAYKDMLGAYVGTGKKKKSYESVPRPLLYEYMAKDVIHTGLLFRKFFKDIFVGGDVNLKRAYRKLLIPASNALATIELNGMPIDQEVLATSEKELEGRLVPKLQELRKLVGDREFNPNSNVQVLDALKTMYQLKINSTDKDTLKKHKDYPLVKSLLEYRATQKMISTYIRPFKKFGARVHTSFLLHGTVTGRLSSTSPNMQNIPKEDIVRRHFRTKLGRVFVSFDYSQAELRSLAVLSGDKNLIEIFRSGKDMHTTVAGEVYGHEFLCEPEFLPNSDPNIKIENPVFNKFRRNAKTVNFGIVYGATEPTLMERLGITWDEAHKLIVGWFAMFPDARKFMDECRRAPVSGRPLVTVFGRKRRFYVVTDANKHGLENEAGNFPHQSMCSDFTLASAIEIDAIVQREPLPGNAIQVNIIHDDNMFECDDDDSEIVKLANIVRPIMEGVPVKQGITLLPFKSDAKKGNVWSQMQKIRGL